MRNLFEHTSAPWFCYTSYEYRETEAGDLYVVVSKDAEANMYYPMKEPEEILMDAVRVGKEVSKDKDGARSKELVLEFVNKYGFLGLMTALPTTTNFIEYESVYLPKNHFIKEEVLSTYEYLDYFFPFEKLDFTKNGDKTRFNVSDKVGMAALLTMGNAPITISMSFQRQYAERYDWLAQEFCDWIFAFMTCFLYYKDKDTLNDETKKVMHLGMRAFGAIAPTYRLELGKDHPIIIWDFHSLAVMLQMSFSFLLSDPDTEISVCKHCGDFFIVKRKGTEFCSSKCKNQYNVYKSRRKKN